MSYRTTSNQTGDLSEQIFYTEMIRKGWMVLTPSSRDAIYDFVVDMGEKGFAKVQVKTLRGNLIYKKVDRSSASVSHGGKVRNSTDYAEHGIDWLVAVDPSSEGNNKCYFYSLERYSQISGNAINITQHPSEEFPYNDKVESSRGKQQQQQHNELPLFNSSSSNNNEVGDAYNVVT